MNHLCVPKHSDQGLYTSQRRCGNIYLYSLQNQETFGEFFEFALHGS